MSTMERILKLMGEKKASDVYLSAHSPALIKINGQCVPINSQLLPPEAPRNLLAEVVAPHHIAELEETGELNIGFPLEGVGRFRVSAMRQRGSYAVDPLCAAGNSAIELVVGPCHSGRPHHGKAWAVADGGRHGRWQEHHAGGHD